MVWSDFQTEVQSAESWSHCIHTECLPSSQAELYKCQPPEMPLTHTWVMSALQRGRLSMRKQDRVKNRADGWQQTHSVAKSHLRTKQCVFISLRDLDWNPTSISECETHHSHEGVDSSHPSIRVHRSWEQAALADYTPTQHPPPTVMGHWWKAGNILEM